MADERDDSAATEADDEIVVSRRRFVGIALAGAVAAPLPGSDVRVENDRSSSPDDRAASAPSSLAEPWRVMRPDDDGADRLVVDGPAEAPYADRLTTVEVGADAAERQVIGHAERLVVCGTADRARRVVESLGEADGGFTVVVPGTGEQGPVPEPAGTEPETYGLDPGTGLSYRRREYEAMSESEVEAAMADNPTVTESVSAFLDDFVSDPAEAVRNGIESVKLALGLAGGAALAGGVAAAPAGNAADSGSGRHADGTAADTPGRSTSRERDSADAEGRQRRLVDDVGSGDVDRRARADGEAVEDPGPREAQ